MDLRPLQRTHALAAGIVVAATMVLATQLLASSPATVSTSAHSVTIQSLGQSPAYSDLAVIAVTACAFGASGTYLLVDSQSAPATPDESLASQAVPDRAQPTADSAVEDRPEPSDDLLDARRREWDETASRLANNEQVVYETVLDADGVLPQSDIVEQTSLSKATVSRTLDSLEAKSLLERKRRGMGNVVVLL